MAGEQTQTRPSNLDDAEAWRLECFLGMGFLYDDAITLAVANANHAAVERALAAGCTKKLALRIFR